MLKLNIGSGAVSDNGWTNIDRKLGREAYPLEFETETVEEIRASHILEHFPHGIVHEVLKDWYRVLVPGGRIRIAVPDFAYIATQYIDGQEINVQGYTMGGQVDKDDYHYTLFDESSLEGEMSSVGFENIRHWKGDMDDCSTLPVSLNLEGIKPSKQPITASKRGESPSKDQLSAIAIMSMPRLGFADNFLCVYQALAPNKIPFRTVTGAYWAQCLERGIDDALDELNPDLVLTLDYDTVFTADDVALMRTIMTARPDIDALAAIQSHRGSGLTLMTKKGPDGKNLDRIPRDALSGDTMQISSAHFGLTMFRTKSLRELEKPWFRPVPNEDGRWGDGRVEEDVYFWQQFEDQGFVLCQANHVVAGHLELTIAWPDNNMQTMYQNRKDYQELGKPKGSWQ